MYAIIEAGGKQVKVSPGDRIRVEKLKTTAGEAIKMDRVLMLSGEGIGVAIGAPYVAEAEVDGRVIRQARTRKITMMRYKPKKRIRIKRGARQDYTLVEIHEIRHKNEVVGRMEERKAQVPAPPKPKAQKAVKTAPKPKTEAKKAPARKAAPKKADKKS